MSVKRTWKAIERKIARYFGSERTPLSGGNSKQTRSDSLHPLIYAECKYRECHSAVSLWRDTAEKARAEDKIPCVCLAEKGRDGFWLVIHSGDLLAVANQRYLAAKDGI